MTSKRFVVVGLGGLVICLAMVAVVARVQNIYGLFGDVKGKAYRPYHPYERVSKYLFTYNYIPSNFDALLISSSIGINWRTSQFEGCRMYNLGIRGGNISEQRILVDEIVKRGKVRLAVILFNPLLLRGFEPNTTEFEPKQYWSSFGSVRLAGNTLVKLATQRHLLKEFYDDSGRQDYNTLNPRTDTLEALMAAAIAKAEETSSAYRPIPQAIDQLKAVIKALTDQGATIVVVYPPFYADYLKALEKNYREFQEVATAALPPGTLVLDFNTPAYDAIRTDFSNFHDAVHFSDKGADVLVAEVNRFLQEKVPEVKAQP